MIGDLKRSLNLCGDPDTKGNTVMKIQARRQGREILLHVEGGNGSFQVRNLGSQKIKVED